MTLVQFLLRGFRPPAEALGALGPLETRVMDAIWARPDEACVRDVFEVLGSDLAYTTVMTTLDRLYKKGLLSRRREGRGFLYRARVSRQELSSGVVSGVVDALLGDPAEARPVLSSIVDAVGDRDRAMLDELERLVREKRRALARRQP
jgi:predicted transcriptional regulator